MNSRDPDFQWHVNGLYVALGPNNAVYTDTAETTAHGARASLLARTNEPWSKLQELGYSIQGYVQPVKPMAISDQDIERLADKHDLYMNANSQNYMVEIAFARDVLHLANHPAPTAGDALPSIRDDAGFRAAAVLYARAKKSELPERWEHLVEAVNTFVRAALANQPAPTAALEQVAPLQDEDYQAILGLVLSGHGMQRYRNGDGIEIHPSQLRVLIDAAQSGISQPSEAAPLDAQLVKLARDLYDMRNTDERLRFRALAVDVAGPLLSNIDAAPSLPAAVPVAVPALKMCDHFINPPEAWDALNAGKVYQPAPTVPASDAAEAWVRENVSPDMWDAAIEAFNAGRAHQPAQQQADLQYRICCDHPDCTTCAGHGGFYRLAALQAPVAAAPAAQPALVDVPDLPIMAEEPPTAVSLIDRAVDALLRMRAINTTMHARFSGDSPSYRDCRSIDDEIHNALAALGQ